jgi:hypothetical protein
MSGGLSYLERDRAMSLRCCESCSNLIMVMLKINSAFLQHSSIVDRSLILRLSFEIVKQLRIQAARLCVQDMTIGILVLSFNNRVKRN